MQQISKPHFFVLNKGLNSGKPLLVPFPNSFAIQTESKEFKEAHYCISYALVRTKG